MKFTKIPSDAFQKLQINAGILTTDFTPATGTIGEKISIRRFVRFEMGEGLEKRKDNFAEEINEQLAKRQG